MSTPVAFLAFANDPDAPLKQLERESAQVFDALSELNRNDFVRIHREEIADSEKIFARLLSFKDRVAIFHYGGHADGTTLRLEGGAAHARGLAGLLGEQANLKLVFLNGCSTDAQVGTLLDAGVKAVIATSVPIGDTTATEFATRFYEALANRRTIEGAFELALAFLRTTSASAPGAGVVLHRGEDSSRGTQFLGPSSWALHVQESFRDEVLNWKLPQYRHLEVGLPRDMIQYIGRSFTANRYIVLVLDEMAKFNPDIYSQMVEQRDGETVKRDSSIYPHLIIKNLPWPVGSQVRLLQQNRVAGLQRLKQLVSTYLHTSQLLYYILLSDLWERRRDESHSGPGSIDLGQPMDQASYNSFDFLAKTMELQRGFDQAGLTPYVAELERVFDAWNVGASALRKAHAFLEQLRAELGTETVAGDFEQRCLVAEQAVSVVLKASAFLARYRMLTVRNIQVEAPRFSEIAYELDLGRLSADDGGGLSLYQDGEHRRKASYGSSHSVILTRDEDRLDQGLNLSPFIVDKHTFVQVMKGETIARNHLPKLFVLAYAEGERLVYLAVEHSLSHALATAADQIHTDMTKGDFDTGRNVTGVDAVKNIFESDEEFGSDEAPTEGDNERVFTILRNQYGDFLADMGELL